jgi:cellulose synthase/poly-beta-1,6-N-acetylglucosamine synthase-like glycosyltransferase
MSFIFASIMMFSAAVALVLGYPALIFLLKCIRMKKWIKANIVPSISIIIPSHGSKLLGGKILNTLSAYPKEKMQIVVVYSGNDKNVLQELDDYNTKGLITLVHEHTRSGKANAINLGLEKTNEEICIITDSDSLLQENGLMYLVSSFADERVGAVSGELIYTGDSPIHGLFFNKYKKSVKNWEAEIDSCSYAPGELLAFRKKLIERLPVDAVTDDYYILLKVKEKGYRCVSEPKAIVYEKTPMKVEKTAKRTRRVVSGTLIEANRFRAMMFNPNFNLFGLLIFPSYIIRLLLLPILAASASISLILGIIQIGTMLPTQYIVPLILGITFFLLICRNLLTYFSAIILGMTCGIADYMTGRSQIIWEDVK